MSYRVLYEDWSDYDQRKKPGTDPLLFSCDEDWEREYLVRKIRHFYPEFSEAAVSNTIRECCRALVAPRPRDKFVALVMQRLRI